VARHIVRALLLLFWGTAFFLTIRLVVAEAEFRLNHAERYEASPEELRTAVTLNPRLSSAWIQLGLDAEADGNLSEAETDLLRAASVDRLYVPAWTLANFYFRRGDAAKFWPWAKRAAALTYDDYRPLLRLGDALETSAPRVATRLGGGASLLRAYLDILINAHRLDSAQDIARLLAARRDPVDRDRLAAFAELLK
jgi:tetratricopeptide (TPR) repeat protein